MKIYISGGCKNGKTSYAQSAVLKLAKGRPHVYVATMTAKDDEDRARIAKHIEDRAGLGFITAEKSENISTVLNEYGQNAVYLVDSITALLENALYPGGHEAVDPKTAEETLLNDLLAFSDKAEDAVFVSDYIFSEAQNYSSETLFYMKSLAEIDKALAAKCDVLIEMQGGNIICHKGDLQWI